MDDNEPENADFLYQDNENLDFVLPNPLLRYSSDNTWNQYFGEIDKYEYNLFLKKMKTDQLFSQNKFRRLDVKSKIVLLFQRTHDYNFGHMIYDDLFSIYILLKMFKLQNNKNLVILFNKKCSCPLCLRTLDYFKPIFGDILFANDLNMMNIYRFDKLIAGTGDKGIHNDDNGVVFTFNNKQTSKGRNVLYYSFIKWYKKKIRKFYENQDSFLNTHNENKDLTQHKKIRITIAKKNKDRTVLSHCTLNDDKIVLIQNIINNNFDDFELNIYDFSNLNITENLKIMNETDIFITTNGASSLNGLFLKPGSIIITLEGIYNIIDKKLVTQEMYGKSFKMDAYFLSTLPYLKVFYCLKCCEKLDEDYFNVLLIQSKKFLQQKKDFFFN